MAFQQAQIQVQKAEEFQQLRSVVERVFASGTLEKFYRKLQGEHVRVREFERVLERRIFEELDPVLARSGKTAKQLYSELAVSDQSLVREFYLERIEQVDPKLREKFQKIYRYY
jgi:hypothetical protein